VYGVHHIFDLIEPSRSRSRSTEACSNGGLLQLATVLGVCARCAFSIGGVDAETIPEREREREIWRRKIWQKASLSFLDQFLQAYTDVHLKQQLLSLSLSLSVLPSLSASNKPHHEKRPSSFSLHSPFLRPFRNIPFACSISSPLSLSLSLHTHSNVSQELDGRHPRREEQR
jgi:hypothetical protein